MNTTQIKTLQNAVTALILAKSNARVNWTAATLLGNGLHVEGEEATLFEGCAGVMEDGWYFPTEKEISNAIRSMSGYVGPDRTESGRGMFGRLGGSSRRSRYHAGHVVL